MAPIDQPGYVTRRARPPRRTLITAAACAISLAGACSKSSAPQGQPDATADASTATWQLVGSALPSALLSVSGNSASDLYAVGADLGTGPLVVHFNGTSWTQLDTGFRASLWWVQAFTDGTTIMSGTSATILKYDGTTFTRMLTPGLAAQTIYGVWGTSSSDFYAVGSEAGRAPFIWHWDGTSFTAEPLPLDLPKLSNGELPGFFKVWGQGSDVWVVGAQGTMLHKSGAGAFTTVATNQTDTLFTINGTTDHVLAVGGATNGVALSGTATSAFTDVTPNAAPLLQGVFATSNGDWASGEGGAIFQRAPGGAFTQIDHGLSIPPSFSLHSAFVDASGGAWFAGGDVLTPALGNGMLVHYGTPVAPLTIGSSTDAGPDASSDATPPVVCPPAVVSIAKDKSIARRWDEQILAAIRLDLPRPPVHARNLFHLSAAMWDAWAAYDTTANGVFVKERQTATDVATARNTSISYAAYDLLIHRYQKANGGPTTVACLNAVMADLGLDPTDAHDTGNDPIAFGNRIAHTIITATQSDGSNEAGNYADTTGYTSINPPLVVDDVGTTMTDPNTWQPLNLSVAATQNGIILPSGVQSYIGSDWGGVTPFAMTRASTSVPWHDPGPAPVLGSAMVGWITEVITRSSELDPTDGATIDVSPGAYGNNSLGANDGTGHPVNPVTSAAYASQVVPRGDFGRIMGEFWADGPNSETPPGHWNVLANGVADSPGFSRQFLGTGASLDPLTWDVRVYLALNGAVHDAAITAWDNKRRTLTVRPISLIRYMGGKGQSSDPSQPSYDPDGLPLVPGLIELITAANSAPGQPHADMAAFVGQIAIRAWLGSPGDPVHQDSGCGWIRAIEWMPYQKRTFVTPAFPGFISGHSTFSRAAAEVLAAFTGTPYFPGGIAEYDFPANSALTFEQGPSVDVKLQWATYFDASDQAGQSRIWGGIHITADDFIGRNLGHQVGLDAAAMAQRYFAGTGP